MNTPTLKTDRLILRKFTENDIELYIKFSVMLMLISFCRGFH